MVGDRFHDFEVAEKAGIPFIGCSYGFGGEEELDGAAMKVAAPYQIPEAVRKVLA